MRLSATTTRPETQAKRARVLLEKLHAIRELDCPDARKELLVLIPKVSKLLAQDIRGSVAPDDPTHHVGLRFLEEKRRVLKRCSSLSGLGGISAPVLVLYAVVGGALYYGIYRWLTSD